MSQRMDFNLWGAIVWDGLYDIGHGEVHRVPGTCLRETLSFLYFDWDDVDRIYIDCETIGGG